MSGIDWTPVTSAIVALIAVLISTFIPMAIKRAFEAWSAKLAKAKTVIDQNQEVVDAIVMVIQQTLGALENSAKYQVALQRVDEALHLPPETAHDMIELAVATAKLQWGECWSDLATKPETTP
jgi:aspartate ammonia-lyase